jgi:7-cyano-7-deazaguanine synthase
MGNFDSDATTAEQDRVRLGKALVVLSGGQDSTTCLFWACKLYGVDNVHTLTFNYGQRHAIELEAAAKVAEMAGVFSGRREVVNIPQVLVSTSPLTSGNALEQYTDAKQMEQVIGERRETTFVPMRNALFLTIAANRAEAYKCQNIVLGVCQMDNANYDDCRQVFLDAAEKYVNTALGHDHRGTGKIRLIAPLMLLTKADTVRLARELPGCWDALAHSHTSYDGQYPPTDMNHANVLRAQGFEEAGLPDPLVLRAWYEGLMELPNTSNYSHSARAHAYAEKI